MVGGRGSGFATGRSNGEGSEGSARQGATLSERSIAWVQGVHVPLVLHRLVSQTARIATGFHTDSASHCLRGPAFWILTNVQGQGGSAVDRLFCNSIDA